MSKAYLVVGPESSGNRLMARLLIAAGCYGDGDMFQRLDDRIPTPEEIDQPLVWVRSYPHGPNGEKYKRHWPDIYNLIEKLRERSWSSVTIVVMVRDMYCVISSQVAHGHALDHIEAAQRCTQAYFRIFQQLSEMPFGKIPIIVTYEGLINNPEETMGWLIPSLGLGTIDDYVFPEKITNQNLKHYIP